LGELWQLAKRRLTTPVALQAKIIRIDPTPWRPHHLDHAMGRLL